VEGLSVEWHAEEHEIVTTDDERGDAKSLGMFGGLGCGWTRGR